MPRPRAKPESKSAARVSLHLGNSFSDAWEHAIFPWFKAAAGTAITASQPVVVVTPSPNYAAFLRGQLLAHKTSLFGIKFLSPFRLREMLLRGSGLTLSSPEERRLLLGAAADEIINQTRDEESATMAKAVARDPDQFLRAFEQLDSAGWNFEHVDPPPLRNLARRFAELSNACGFASLREANTAIAAAKDIAFSHLLIAGFDGAHWPVWPILRAATERSSDSVIILHNPRAQAREIDELWIGTWEEAFGAAQPIPAAEEPRTLSDLATALDTGAPLPETAATRKRVYFLVGADSTEQAKAIVALVANFLRDERCTRLGIVFPSRGSLSRLVAHYLQAAAVPHTDSIAHLGPNSFDTTAWRAWLEMQENPSLQTVIGFARIPDQARPVFGKLPIFKAEKILRRAYGDVLLNDIAVLRQYCAEHIRNDEEGAVSRALEAVEFLDPVGRLSDFVAATRKIFTALNWTQHANEVERLTRNWSDRLTTTLSKRLYLRWLRESLGRSSMARDDAGNHPYSRVHLLTHVEAEGQSWSHLIFAGLNEESWPATDEESAYSPDRAIGELNQQNRTLNRRSVRTGGQGEGQTVIRPDRSFLLGTQERRALAVRRLINLVEATGEALGATANLYSETFPSRIANPNEFFSRLFFAARGAGVSQQTMRSLQGEAANWLGNWSPIDAQKVDSISVGRTRYAYDARRQVRPAGEYEFALRSAPVAPLSLRVTEWERAMRWPALTWLRVVLGVESEDESGDGWAIATGQWAHDWLAQGVPEAENQAFVPLVEVETLRKNIFDAAQRFLEATRELCRAGRRPLPDWWISGWSNALYIADCLAAKLSNLRDWTSLTTERLLENPTVISLGKKGEELRLRGRIDLILARGEPTKLPINYPDLWVVDYKTGKQRGFNLRELRGKESSEEKYRKQLVDGRGVQLGLYALAVCALGATEVRLTLLSPVGELESQFTLNDVLAQQGYWLELYRMQETGIFGMLGEVHAEFGAVRSYPLATLPIDPDLLQEKWELTHPPFAIVRNEKAEDE